jgi:hypothetical protein
MAAAAVERGRIANNRRAMAARHSEGRRRNKPGDAIRLCQQCKREFPAEAFRVSPKGVISSYCGPCANDLQHMYGLRHRLGVEPEQYYQLLAAQEGVCAICGRAPRKQHLAVDHNHKTGAIRGLLCVRCNHKVLGGSGENVDVLRRAADYLENPPAEGRRLTVQDISPRELERQFTELEQEIASASATTGVLVIKRRAHIDPADWYAILPFADWCHLAKDAGL